MMKMMTMGIIADMNHTTANIDSDHTLSRDYVSTIRIVAELPQVVQEDHIIIIIIIINEDINGMARPVQREVLGGMQLHGRNHHSGKKSMAAAAIIVVGGTRRHHEGEVRQVQGGHWID